MTLNRDGPAAWELPSNIRSNLIAIVSDLFVWVPPGLRRMGMFPIDIRFGQSRAR